MPSHYLDTNKLERALELTVDRLEKEGVVKAADKDNLINEVMDNIMSGQSQTPELDMNDVRKSFESAVRFVLSHQDLKKELKLEFDPKLLFQKDLSPEQKKQLERDIEKILTKMNKMLPKEKQKTDKQIKEMAQTIANDFTKEGQNELIKDPLAMDFLAALTMVCKLKMENQKKQELEPEPTPEPKPNKPEPDQEMSEQEIAYRKQHAGMNPTTSGGEQMIVYELDPNDQNFLNQTQGLATDMSQMADLNRYDTDRPDYTGAEFRTLMEEISAGAEINSTLEQELVSDGVLPSNSPRPTPYGGS